VTAFNYGRPKATADRLIARFGQAGTLRRMLPGSGPAYDPGEPSPDDYAATFAVLDFNGREIDGSRVLATDKKILLANGALAIQPTLSDKLVIGDVEHSIINIETLAPGGTVVMWTLQVRR